jgi:hypothetical protein
VLALLNSAAANVSDALLALVIAGADRRFLDLARANPAFRRTLVDRAASIRFPALLEFVPRLVGVDGTATFVARDGFTLGYDATFGLDVRFGAISGPPDRLAVLAVAVLMYTQCGIENLPPYFDRRDLADRLCTVCERSMVIPPEPLRSHVLEFVEETWIAAAGDIDFVAKLLPRMRHLRIHERIFPKINIKLLVQASLKYIDEYTREDRIWLSRLFPTLHGQPPLKEVTTNPDAAVVPPDSAADSNDQSI